MCDDSESVLKQLKAGDFMSIECFTVKKNEKIGAADILMTRKHIGGLPVVNDQKQVIGIITQRDIMLSRFSINEPGMTVEDLMTSKVVTCTSETKLPDILKEMHENSIERVPVVDAENKLVGMVVQSDIIRLLYKYLVLGH
jgi:CBS domain-containing protein